MWTDQCVNAFKMEVESFLWKKRGDLKDIIEKMSLKSGIPEDLLYSWWNGSYKKTQALKGKVLSERRKCRLCKDNFAEVSSSTGKTYSSQVCSTCRKKATWSKRIDKNVSAENGRLTVCPRCQFVFYVKEKTK